MLWSGEKSPETRKQPIEANAMTVNRHPILTRRSAIQAGGVGLLGLGSNHLKALRAADTVSPLPASSQQRSVIYIFLSGGLGQHDSFDMKPEAPYNIRGEFLPVSTQTPGLQICEHMPELAKRSNQWSIVRSLTHPYNEHSQGHMVMLSGRTPMPPTFSANKPMPEDWPAIASIAGDHFPPVNNLPPAVVLPERLIHRTGRVIPGQFAGQMGRRRDPWFVSASPFNGTTYGAFPEYEFHHARGTEHVDSLKFQAPSLDLPEGFTHPRISGRLSWSWREGRAAGLPIVTIFRHDAVSTLRDRTEQWYRTVGFFYLRKTCPSGSVRRRTIAGIGDKSFRSGRRAVGQ